MGDKRSVVDPLGQFALVARQYQYMVEVEVARFQHAHNLHTLSRFAVERNGGRLQQLAHEFLQDGYADNLAACGVNALPREVVSR